MEEWVPGLRLGWRLCCFLWDEKSVSVFVRDYLYLILLSRNVYFIIGGRLRSFSTGLYVVDGSVAIYVHKYSHQRGRCDLCIFIY